MKTHIQLYLFALLLVGCDAVDVHSHEIKDYQAAKDVFWSKVYPEGSTIYCNKKFTHSWREGINVEHVFPMAWVKKTLNCGTRDQCRRTNKLFNKIEADMHNLYPSIEQLNYDRQSYRFGNVPGEKRQYGAACDFEVDKKRRVAEPRKLVRGELARAMLYMEYRYHDVGLKLFNKQASLMLKWHYEDLPSQEEKHRNIVIERYQGNRNPFIDDVTFAEQYKKRRNIR